WACHMPDMSAMNSSYRLMQCSKPACYSITKSARASSVGGIVRPRVLVSLKVDRELEFCGLDNGQVAWSLALENPSNVGACLAVHVALIGAVTHQTPGSDKFALRH